MNFSIQYRTSYAYSGPVTENMNTLRVRPAATSSQRADEFSVRVTPEARLHQHVDYFGTHVHEFEVVRPHDALAIDIRARVVTTPPGEPPDPTWDALESPAYERAGGEFLLDIGDRADADLTGLASETRDAGPLATLTRLVDLIPDTFSYQRGITYVGSTIADLLEARAGVCQDFAHLGLVLLRRNGIAARYCSGYLFSAAPDEGPESVEVDTHAWIEALLPDAGTRGEPAWVGVDPTNRQFAGERHVKIGHGRSYSDVPPIKGVYRGTCAGQMDTTVTMTRLDPAESATT